MAAIIPFVGARLRLRLNREAKMRGRRILALLCWIMAGFCGSAGAALENGIGDGLGVAAIWFLVTGGVLLLAPTQ